MKTASSWIPFSFLLIIGLGSLLSVDVHAEEDSEAALTEDGKVLVLTEDNFEEAINQYAADGLLIEFYAPWCGHCKQLEPEYAQAAEALRDLVPNARLAKCDATKYKELAEMHGVNSFPTMYWWSGGDVGKRSAGKYEGGRTAQEIVDWVVGKTSGSVIDVAKLQSAEEVDALVPESRQKLPVALFRNGAFDDLEVNAMSEWMRDVVLVRVKDDSEAPDLTILRPKGDATATSIISSAKELKSKNVTLDDFLCDNAALVPRYSRENANEMFTAKKQMLVLFRSLEEQGVEAGLAAEKAFREAAAKADRPFQNFSAMVCGVEGRTERLLLDYAGVQVVPTLRIVEEPLGKLKRYKKDPYGKPFVVRDFVDFAQEYEMGATIPFLRSQVGVKNDEDAKVLKVTGDTFEELVRAPKSAVMVSFNAQVCPPCENVNKILTNLAEELGNATAKLSEPPAVQVKFAKIDADLNDPPEDVAEVKMYPSVKLFLDDESSKSGLPYVGKLDEDGLRGWLKKELDGRGLWAWPSHSEL